MVLEGGGGAALEQPCAGGGEDALPHDHSLGSVERKLGESRLEVMAIKVLVQLLYSSCGETKDVEMRARDGGVAVASPILVCVTILHRPVWTVFGAQPALLFLL